MESLYFEDFTVGQQFASGPHTIEKDAAVAFASVYDPQYFHTDETTAHDSLFGKLVVSGWQTAAITMRLKAMSALGRIKGGLIGLGLETVRWQKPVYPGDTLRIVITITGTRPSRSRPGHGIIQYQVETFNQGNALVMRMLTSVLAARKASSALGE